MPGVFLFSGRRSGPVKDGYLGDNWSKIDNVLKCGLRGLPGGSSRAFLLIEARGVRINNYAPDLTDQQILAWVDRPHAETGVWPTEDSGPLAGTLGEVWINVVAALAMEFRGLVGGDSLARRAAHAGCLETCRYFSCSAAAVRGRETPHGED